MTLLPRISFADYCEFEGVNISSLKAMRRSPLHYLEAAAKSKRPSKAMALGSAAHCAVLEPARFVSEYAVVGSLNDNQLVALDVMRKGQPVAVYEGAVRRGKAWESFAAEHQGPILTQREYDAVAGLTHKTPIAQVDYDLCLAMRDAVRGHDAAADLLLAGEPEISMIWVDAVTGIDCKGRADWVAPGHIVVGLKTASRADTHAFPRQAASLGYHLQWAFYADGYEAITGARPTMVEIVVESDRPHDVVVYEIGEDTLEQGRREYLDLLARLRDCVDEDRWPGMAPQPIPFSLPIWAMHEPDATLTIGGQEVEL